MGSCRIILAVLAMAFVVPMASPARAGEAGYFERGMTEWKQGNYSKAIENFTKEIEANPANHSAYYNLGLVYDQAGEPFKAYSAWQRYLKLNPSKPWADKARRHIERLEVSGVFKGLVVEEVKIANLFPSIYKYYTAHPIGYIVLKNMGKEPVQDVKASFKVERYMDSPTGSGAVKELMPEEALKIDLYATFNNLIMELTEDTPVQPSIYLSYRDGGKEVAREERTRAITIHNRSAMTWSPSSKLASFVTLKDEPVINFSRDVIKLYKEDMTSFIPENIYKAMLFFNILGAYRMEYIPDPAAPVRASESEKLEAIDYIQYPADTLRLGTGDCDDGVALYTSLLEGIGIRTAFVDFPDHVYPMFDTGLSPKDADRVSPIPGSYIVYEDSLWVPVETTLWKRPFAEAWASAVDKYHKTPDSKKRIVDIEESWKDYNPATLIYTRGAPRFQLPPKEDVDRMMARDVEEQRKVRMDSIARKYQNLMNAKPDDYKAHNELGAVYGGSRFYDEAIAQFKKALGVKPDYIKARANLGYVYFQRRMYEDALRELKLALEAEPTKARRYYDVALIYYQKRQYEAAQENLNRAVEIDPAYKDKLSEMSMVKAGERGDKAAEALIEIEIEWEVE
jgi:tetratricopeptide (TPR) repeat protein